MTSQSAFARKHTATARAGPYRGQFGLGRPEELAALALPPERMPLQCAGRPLKRWRYVGFFCPEAIVCVARVRVGPLPDAFWAVWDREAGRLWRGRIGVTLRPERATVRWRRVRLELSFAEVAGIETVCPSGRAYGWTRKQGGLPGTARLQLAGPVRELRGHVLIDDTAAYYERHTRWQWSAGAGRTVDGRSAAWNLVSGVNDPAQDSERTVWLDGTPSEVPPCEFAGDLSAVDELHFKTEAVLARRTNLGLVRSSYRQPLGRYSGLLPGGVELAEGFGVMEDHDAWW